jgi:23S rRNA pseudouridine1911/1915/1917 synthase
VVLLTAKVMDAGKRLDSFLHERLPEYSRSRLQAWIKDGRVLLDGLPARASYPVHGHEVIEVHPAELAPLRAEAEELPLEVLYEDADVVVVNKPAGMVVHAGAGNHRGTLVNALLHHFGSLSSISGDLRPGIVHRLDRETSGVLLAARTDKAHQALARQFHDREVEKTYLALAHGRMRERQGRIETPIARDPVRRTRMTTKLKSGRPALTEYRVLEEFEGFSYLTVRIGTGRTHQIRVHLASLHHPIAGDRLYGAPAKAMESLGLQRFFLHAHVLRFRSPSTGEWISIESPLPTDLQACLNMLRQG